MATTCPHCHAEIQPGDQFCPTCGQRVEPGVAEGEFTPIGAAPVSPRRRRSRRPWYRRWRLMVPLALVALILLTLGAGAWYIKTRFDTLNELSTPPPEISGARLGGDEELTIDTGPAQDAVREAEARRAAARNNPPPTLMPTDAPGAAGETDVPGAAGGTEAPGAAGETQAPGVIGATEAPGAGGETEAPGAAVGTEPAGAAGSTEDPGGGDQDARADIEDTQTPPDGPDATRAAQTGARGNATRASGDVGEAPGGTAGDAGAARTSAGGQGAPVIEINAQGSPVLMSEPIGTPSLAAAPEPVEQDSYAFLMMGVDARPGEAIDVGVRPDSLFVVYLDGSNGSCRVLSIPRDTRTTLPGYGQSKINHALAVGGVPYERLVVENLLGIEIEHYGLIDFAGVEQLVDAVGGVTVQNEYAFSTGEHTFPAGSVELSGEEALAYSRFRSDERGDFGRQERQQAVVRALLTKGAGMDVVTAVPQLLGEVDDHIRTDLGPDDMVDIAQDFRSTCNGDTLKTERVEGDVAWAYDDLMQMELSFVLVDRAEVEQKVSWLLTGSEGPAPAAPAPTPPASPVATPPATAEPTRPRQTPTATEPVR